MTDKFDPTNLRLSQDFASIAGVKKALITVPVRKPTRQEFVRVHPDEAYRLQTVVLELKEERETYLVSPNLWSELPGELVPKLLLLTMSRQNVLTIWPIRLPGEDGRIDSWSESAMTAAEMAKDSWVRVAANMSLSAYEVFQATGDLPDPVWPEKEFRDILGIAFKGRFIEDLDHPAIRRLRGEE